MIIGSTVPVIRYDLDIFNWQVRLIYSLTRRFLVRLKWSKNHWKYKKEVIQI